MNHPVTGGSRAKTVAVVDLGSISTRLLIAGNERIRPSPIVTRMGAGVTADGRISPASLERVRDALIVHRELIESAQPEAVRVIATSAARDAGNQDELFSVVDEVLGCSTELLSGSEEGRLAFLGALGGVSVEHLAPDQRAVVLDIGGGSTEISVGTSAGGLAGVHSADIGAGRVTESHLESDPPRAEELSAALSVIQLHFDDARRILDDLDGAIARGPVIGLGGTITTVAAVELGLAEYDSERIHGFKLEHEAVEDVFRTLATEAAVDRAFNPGLPADRVDLIVGGIVILVEAMRHLAIDEVVVSEFDLLDGAASELQAD